MLARLQVTALPEILDGGRRFNVDDQNDGGCLAAVELADRYRTRRFLIWRPVHLSNLHFDELASSS